MGFFHVISGLPTELHFAYASGILAFVAFVFILSACEETPETPKPFATGVTAPTEQTDNDKESSHNVQKVPTEVQVPPSFRTSLEKIAFSEESENASQSILTLDSLDLRHEPAKIVHHWEGISIILEFSDISEEGISSLLDQIEIEGKRPDFLQIGGNTKRYRLRLSRPAGTSFDLKLGDLPLITIERAIPLSVKPVSGTGEDDSNKLLLRTLEYGVQLFVPMEEKSVTLQFSEDMKPLLPTAMDGAPVQAEWKDSRNLHINLDGAGTLSEREWTYSLRVDKLESQSGNRLRNEESLYIRRVPSNVWKYNHTGEPFDGNVRDRFYDQLIVSPDGEHYVGVVGLGGSMGDGDGWSYSFILERKGEAPIVLERVFYSTIQEDDDSPIRWIDSNTLLYATFYGVYSYNTDTFTKTTLHKTKNDESDNVNYAVWDPFRHQLYVLAHEDRNVSSMTTLYTYTEATEQPTVQPNFSDSVLVSLYSLLDLSIFPTANGVYWTRTKDGIPYTEYVHDDGSQFSTKGVVRLATAKEAYVQRYAAGENNIMPDGWLYWRPGQLEKPMTDPPGPGEFIRSGDNLLFRSDRLYYQYDPNRNEWAIWKAPGGEQHAEPVRGSEPLYRVFADDPAQL